MLASEAIATAERSRELCVNGVLGRGTEAKIGSLTCFIVILNLLRKVGYS